MRFKIDKNNLEAFIVEEKEIGEWQKEKEIAKINLPKPKRKVKKLMDRWN